MSKKSTIWLTVVLCVLLTLVAACGTNNASKNPSKGSSTVPASENLYVLDGYAPRGAGNQQIVAFHPGSANPGKLVTLPAGLTSSNHQKLYTAAAKNGQTKIAIFDTHTGATIRSLTITGTYSTAEQSYANSVVSSNGHWLALRELGQTGNQTTIALIDTETGQLTKTIRLNGNFDLDAVSLDGSSLYLLERLNDHTGHYLVRLYNVAENELYQNPIIDKNEINDPRMTGSALTRQMSNDGTQAYTLYIDTAHNIAFVHILPLNASLPFARCIDLPAGKSADLLHYYTLALATDGSTLYAANGALGVVSKISLHGEDIYANKVDATVRFSPGNASMISSDKTRLLYNGAVLSPDQKMLYFAGMHGIWAVNTLALSTQNDSAIQSNYLTQQALTSVAISSDGGTLYAVDPTSGITLLDSATGQVRQVIQGPVQAPWGIEWITN